MPYIVSLVDCTDTMQDRGDIRRLLQDWFSRAGRARTEPMQVTVEWTITPTQIANLVIYFVRDCHRSVLRHLRHFRPPPNWEETGGVTFLANAEGAYRSGSRHGSEVYLNICATTSSRAMA